MEKHRLAFSNASDRQLALLRFFDELYRSGHTVAEGTKVWAAFMHIYPEYGKHGAERLPRIPRALQGWEKLAPNKFRFPLPEELVAALAIEISRGDPPSMPGDVLAGLMTVLALDCYLRPGETVGLRCASVVPSAPRLGSAYRYTTLLLAPFTLGRPTKTGLFDESLTLDSVERAWLGLLLEELARGRRPEEFLFDVTMSRWDKLYRAAARRLGAEHLHPVLYLLRHTGASADVLKRRRDTLEVKRRGRWLSDSALRRYEKHARASAQANKLSRALQEHCKLCHVHLGTWLVEPGLAPLYRAA